MPFNSIKPRNFASPIVCNFIIMHISQVASRCPLTLAIALLSAAPLSSAPLSAPDSSLTPQSADTLPSGSAAPELSLAKLQPYLPTFHGTIRPRFEWDTSDNLTRFQVKNARLSAGGSIGTRVDYFMQVDFCSEGSFKLLDFWGRINLGRGVAIQAGQFRMPFGVDPFRAPHNYIFANRSFIGKYVCNYRAVGLKASFAPSAFPLSLEAGIFNPASTSSQTQWSSTVAYSAKAAYRLISDLKVATGFMSVIPYGRRANLIDAAITFTPGPFTFEAEYMNERYLNSPLSPCQAYNFYANYRIPVSWGIFNQWSAQARFDGMTAYSNLQPDANGQLSITQPRRNRLTVGSTIAWVRSANLFFEFKVNYEKYFYPSATSPAGAGQADKLLAEMVLRF